MILTGKTISPGLAHGVTRVLDGFGVLAGARAVPPDGPPEYELRRLQWAVDEACRELERVQKQLTGRIEQRNTEIFAAHAALLRDPQIRARLEHEITTHRRSAEAAVSLVIGELHAQFRAHAAPMLQDKAADLLDIGRRLIQCLAPATRHEGDVGEQTIVVAAAVTPSELVRFAHHGVVGVITESCGPKSHTAILARGLAIPFLTGVARPGDQIPDDTAITLDASSGRIFLDPTPAERDETEFLFARDAASRAAAAPPPPDPLTADGTRLDILLNISDPSEAHLVRAWNTAGIGLFRTEFLYMDLNDWPSADQLYQILCHVSELTGPAELKIRLTDFGAEKTPRYASLPVARNPSLGLRGIRLLLEHPELLEPQIQALTRLARQRPLWVTMPMLDSVDTLNRVEQLILPMAGVSRRDELPFRLGAMIEVPAAALLIDELAARLDSVSIGLNDLTQYLLAADRDDESVDRYYNPLQPALLRLIARIVEATAAAGKSLTVCGELAGDSRLTALLLGLGVRRFSVARSSYRPMLDSLAHFDIRLLRPLAREMLALPTSQAIRDHLAASSACAPWNAAPSET